MRASLRLSLVMIALANTGWAQNAYWNEDPATRIQRLEAETAGLRAELQRLHEQPPSMAPATHVPMSGMPGQPMAAMPAPAVGAEMAPGGGVTMGEVNAAIKKAAWSKGDFKITPYGFLWANTVYETERSNNGDYTFYVLSAQEQGEHAWHVDARNTRLGLDILGPRINCLNCAQSGGKVEIDFQGQFVTENKPGVLLRHAYWEVKDDEFRLLAGQTWDVISPLNPNSIMYSVYWAAGNIGYRRAQFRGERYFNASDVSQFIFQGSLNSDILSENAGAGFTGNQAGWPTFEGRMAYSFGERGPNCHPIVLGVSGHIGNQEFDFANAPIRAGQDIRTWSFNIDLKAPITDRFGVQGELFMGENLGAYLGGILQGVNVATRRPIYSRGGWVEVWYDWTPQWHSHVGYTIDDPLNSDLSLATARTYNSALWGNVIYDVTKQFNLGLEVGSWRTLYLNERPGESIRVEFMAKYGF